MRLKCFQLDTKSKKFFKNALRWDGNILHWKRLRMTADVLEIIWASDVSKIIKCWEENKKNFQTSKEEKN